MNGLFKKLNESKVFKDLSPQEFSWVLYDVGNSAFTMLGCSLIPIWFKSLAIGTEAGKISSDNATAYWALATSIVTVIVALIGPVCGAIADHKDTKKIFFSTAVAVGVIGCILNGFVGSWFLFLIVYILTKIFYQASLTFYDSMLNDVTTEERADQVSSYGYAWGYIGSCIPFILALAFYLLATKQLMPMHIAILLGFGITALWWYVVTIPLLKRYRQKYYVDAKGSNIKESFARIGRTLKTLATKERKILLFLLAFFLYIDGVYTIIDEAVAIGTALGLDQVGLLVVLLLTQVVAFFFAVLFGKLSQKYSTVTLISIAIIGYFAVAIYALFMKTLWQFGIMAFIVGMFQGAIQALSRSYYAKIIPPDSSGEYFGIYDICGKGAAFVGTMLIGVTTKLSGSVNIGVGTLAFLFLGGLILMRAADRAK